ncbi:AAA family ATPase [Anabaena cylindrica UHCC 0172]|uniref:AAA family ATPase n=1 Tax=Anabaena cylindrica TaxID=1165 RepID=UPI002B212EDC|nr:AAA family ATPase [Anabaena cylindrica]MEA5549922.1 AAA family ATPase [Anabaena cylindrica UHCC 0172]
MTDQVEINKGHTQSNKLPKSIKIRNLKIRNFKGLDDIELNFPVPQLKDDPDIIVMGSRNGLGKTSVLESCALLFLAASQDSSSLHKILSTSILTNIPDLLIQAGKEEANISGDFYIGNDSFDVNLQITRSGKFKFHSNSNKKALQELINQENFYSFSTRDNIENFFYSLVGLSTDPTILPHFIYFHSYRKIQEGSPELGMILEEDKSYKRNRFRIRPELTISTFKLEILRSLMSRGGLFENLDNTAAEKDLDTLNGLMRKYASGTIEKLRPSPDNTIEFRVTPTNGGESFTFDGLSSGQKEIISTLFLIWKYTARYPGIVLIDEPELHLNAEWHRRFIHNLYKLAPHNQYIVATHSEDIFASVESDRRILLSSSGDG